MRLAGQRQGQARAEGTIRNYQATKRNFIEFCFNYGIDPINPHKKEVCVWIEYLVQQKCAPPTIKNKI